MNRGRRAAPLRVRAKRRPVAPYDDRFMARAVGIDLGTKRIGVATSDVTATLASPYVVLERRGDRAADHRAIAAIVAEMEADVVVVGLPLSLDGRDGQAAIATRAEASQLEHHVGPARVELFDERFTTVTAHQSMQARGMKTPARRRLVDKVAAAVMLQHWLDSRAGREART